MSWFYYLSRFCIRVVFTLFTRLRIEGKENLPENGSVLVVSNHLSLADPPLLSICLHRKVKFMAKEELFKFLPVKWVLTALGAFPVNRGQVDRKALRRAAFVLDNDMVMVMFPEATRSRDLRLHQAYNGSSLIASRSRVPILPVGLAGSEKISGIGWLFRRFNVNVKIGKPFALPESTGKVTKDDLEVYTNIIMCQIADNLPEEYRGYYACKKELIGVED
ncbi:lysophospholipid acyltransferase family protein [Chloroflexota bacterium]